MVTLPLESSRLVLRRFTLADVPAFAAYRSDPDVARWQDWDSASEAEARAFVERMSHREPGAPGEWFQIAIALKAANALVGDCGLKIHEDPRQATVGITLAREHQGHGLALEALTCLFDHLFARTDVRRVVADTDPGNVAAWSLLERLGMRREGQLVASLWFKGRWADELLYAVLKEEWLAKQPRQ